MTTAKELKEIRISLGLDQLKFAEKLGYTRQFISDMERGVKPITEKTEIRLKNLGLYSENKDFEEKEIDYDDCYSIIVRGDVSASMGYGVSVYEERQTG